MLPANERPLPYFQRAALLVDDMDRALQVYRDLLDCDGELLRAFLEGSGWPMRESFARQALGLALRRQAVGLTQHLTMDVFEPIAARIPLRDVPTLDALAERLFSVRGPGRV